MDGGEREGFRGRDFEVESTQEAQIFEHVTPNEFYPEPIADAPRLIGSMITSKMCFSNLELF